MTKNQNSKPYDLEERTFQFAKAVRIFVKTLPKTIESLSKKDFLMRMKISRKEAKESAYWLRLIHETNNLKNSNDAQSLMQEAIELKKILSSILEKSK
jgi:hypothetical protein